ncbi:MAG: hypothetical protein AN486_25335 [Anabaena sp. AL93]|nr:MAG: hypothetical protein AN486_25335 [Anabaena sp. AL93]
MICVYTVVGKGRVGFALAKPGWGNSLTLSGLKPLRFLKFCNPNILFAQVPKLNTFAQKCVLILLVALLGETPIPHWLIFWAFSC